MQDTAASQETMGIVPEDKPKTPRKRLHGIDAARGVALIGMLAIHILPNELEDTGDPTWTFNLFFGDAAALFVMLAGVGLALASGGWNRHRGGRMMADRVGLAARAVVVGIVALMIAAIIQPSDPETSILLYFAVYFLLAIPFLSLGARALFACAAVFWIVTPFLMVWLTPGLPEWSDANPTVVELITEPVAVASQLLLTGTYPALPYLTFVLVGLGLGRLDLGRFSVQAWIAGIGASLAILANGASAILLDVAGGYERLLQTPGMTREMVDDALVFGPDTVPDSSVWWLAIAVPHTNTHLALASSLGMAMLVLGVMLLVTRKAERFMFPLYAIGAMTMTFYTAHMMSLATEVHYDQPVLWYIVQLAVAVIVGMLFTLRGWRGPLEALTKAASDLTKRLVKDGTATGTTSNPAPGPERSGLAAPGREAAPTGAVARDRDGVTTASEAPSSGKSSR
jgi:uncharacterized membrane protein